MNIDTKLLILFITDRRQLSDDIAAVIEEQRRIESTEIALWFKNFQRKLAAKAEEIDWAKLLREEILDENDLLTALAKKRLSSNLVDEKGGEAKTAIPRHMVNEHARRFVLHSFRAGARLAYVDQIEKLVMKSDLSIKYLFSKIGKHNSSRFSQWKRSGVSPNDSLLEKILGLDEIQLSPSIESATHWGYRLAIVQTNHVVIEGNPSIKTCRGPLDLASYVYLSLAAELLESSLDVFDKLTIEDIEQVHSSLPETILELIPDGQNLSWFRSIVSTWYNAYRIVVKVIEEGHGQGLQTELYIK